MKATKKCPRCDEVKPRGEFYESRRRGRATPELSAYCRPCHAAWQEGQRPKKPRKTKRADGLKMCPLCTTPKTPWEFYSTSGRDGLSAYCRVCTTQKINPIKREHYKGRAKYYKAAEYAKNKRKYWARNLRLLYGLTPEQYEAMHEAQNGLCAICQQPETAKQRNGDPMRLAVDHCHTTGTIRSLLCANCNRTLGLMAESPERLEAAAAYLRRMTG